MGKKLNSEYVKKIFKNNGYKLVSDYTNNETPMVCEKNGYKGMLSYGNLQTGKNMGIFKYSNPFFLDNVRTFVKQKDKNIVVLGAIQVGNKYHRKILITLQCTCGIIYKKTWGSIQSKNSIYCTNCAKRHKGLCRRKDKSEVINLFKKNNYTILNTPVEFVRTDKFEVENSQGYRGFLSYAHLKSGKSFGIFNYKYNQKYYLYNVNLYNKKNGIKAVAIKVLDNAKWSRQGIQFVCECGNIFETSIASFQNGKYRCDKCSKSISILEHKIKTFLDSQHIKYIHECAFYDCRDILPLPFDFYLVDYNKIIEVDGVQHYHITVFNRQCAEEAARSFRQTIKHDIIKNKYCANKNIPLLRIPYWDIEKTSNYKIKISQFIEK